MLVRLKEVELLGEIEWLVSRRKAARSSFALYLVRALGATPALIGRELMRRGSAFQPSLLDAAHPAERSGRLA